MLKYRGIDSNSGFAIGKIIWKYISLPYRNMTVQFLFVISTDKTNLSQSCILIKHPLHVTPGGTKSPAINCRFTKNSGKTNVHTAWSCLQQRRINQLFQYLSIRKNSICHYKKESRKNASLSRVPALKEAVWYGSLPWTRENKKCLLLTKSIISGFETKPQLFCSC